MRNLTTREATLILILVAVICLIAWPGLVLLFYGLEAALVALAAPLLVVLVAPGHRRY